ncbi:MAG: TolC family protein [Bradyrhizobium sp.]
MRQSSATAEQSLKLARERYQSGLTDFTTVLLAEQNLLRAEANAAVARSDVSLGATAIYRALGRSFHLAELRSPSFFGFAAGLAFGLCPCKGLRCDSSCDSIRGCSSRTCPIGTHLRRFFCARATATMRANRRSGRWPI